MDLPLIAGAWISLSLALFAQQGDVAGEEQPALPADLVIPPAPALSWEEELATFALPEGFTIELVAAEPLVRDPVAMTFGTDGRLWVVEMRGYMNDLAGSGETLPVGGVAILSDTDGDGRMDQRTQFVDGLVLPRAIALTREGALVIAPPELLFLRDTDDDGVADERQVVDRGLGGEHNPEHAINGLLPSLDNAFVCANAPWRYVWRDGVLQRQASAGGGQWGITQDDRGRLYHDNNSDPLRGDLVPPHYAARNPNLGLAWGVNQRIAADLGVRPRRVTPGVNRGYRAGLLVDGKLAVATGTCAPWIHRGGTFPKPYGGAAFVCEPCGNLVLAYALEDVDGRPVARALRHGEQRIDFLTSSDERFRPVFLCDGPDGALYVADMYRGLIQHRLFVTSFLEAQVRARGLEQPIGLGRIWRVRPSGATASPPPEWESASWDELAGALEHSNGWLRDRVQQIFVEEGAEEAKAHRVLGALVLESKAPLARLHALWALAGMRGVTAELAQAALADPDERVREAAVRASEVIAADHPVLLEAWKGLARGDSATLRRQVLLSLGAVHTLEGEQALTALLREDASDAADRSCAVSGLGGREAAFLERLLAGVDDQTERPGRAALLRELAVCVAREANAARIARVIDRVVAGRTTAWQREAMVEGLLAGRSPASPGRPSVLRLIEQPADFSELVRLESQLGEPSGGLVRQLVQSLSWPGHPVEGEAPVRPLSESERAAFERGREVYGNLCAGCHQVSGQGLFAMAPSLRGSDWVLGDPERAIRIVLKGLAGPIAVRGDTWDMEMPAVQIGDADLAAALTYVRREWGHAEEPVPVALVEAVRALVADRKKPFTAAELSAIGR